MNIEHELEIIKNNTRILDRAIILAHKGVLKTAKECFDYQKKNGYVWTPEDEAKNIHDIEQGRYD